MFSRVCDDINAFNREMFGLFHAEPGTEMGNAFNGLAHKTRSTLDVSYTDPLPTEQASTGQRVTSFVRTEVVLHDQNQ